MSKAYLKPTIRVATPTPAAMCAHSKCNGKDGAADVVTTTVIGKKVA